MTIWSTDVITAITRVHTNGYIAIIHCNMAHQGWTLEFWQPEVSVYLKLFDLARHLNTDETMTSNEGFEPAKTSLFM